LGRQYGFGAISKVLQGKEDEYLSTRGLDKLPTFGVMRGETTDFIRNVFDMLKKQGYIFVTDDRYQTVSVTEKASEILLGGAKITMKMKRAEPAGSQTDGRRSSRDSGKRFEMQPELWEKLKEIRRRIADESRIPAFVVFSDASLLDMCRKHPLTERELLEVSGVGEVKLKRYGDQFLAVLKSIPRAENTAYKEPARFSTAALKEHFQTNPEPIPISTITDRLNVALMMADQKKTSAKALNDMLESKGYLFTEQTERGNRRRPTEKGEAEGISWAEKTSLSGMDYFQTLFETRAQEFVFEMFVRELGVGMVV